VVCYRHPDREAYVRCQRCERLICPDCQVESAVGFLCVDDAGKQPARSRGRIAATFDGRPVVTQWLLGITVAIYGLQILSGGVLTDLLAFQPAASILEPWRFITAGFVHSDSLLSNPTSVLHLVLNMYTLYLFGQALEPMLGRWRFLALYLISIFGGSIAVMWLATPVTVVVGASGGAFGLMAAYLVVLRSIGANSNSMVGVIAINLVFSFISPSISWEAHVGGLALGALVALLYSKTRDLKLQKIQLLGLAGIVLALVVGGGIRAFMILGEYGLL
jgi:membrane associated rhomboid family serine protease